MQASFPNHPAGEAVASDAADREHQVRPRRVDYVDSENVDSESLEPVQGLFTTAPGRKTAIHCVVLLGNNRLLPVSHALCLTVFRPGAAAKRS
ncbi:hypothetical protein [Chitiniphilus shinanonensis]|uniref:hypothetical protein n=1 Tax=Chitiniphilus shinanonensis TaxID=553088 RepID=UPI00333E895E